jgi:2-keto-4-pentenoate hydratase/2-oxohepta-3-ene-1,7-dioic acid hydratase in catechol pathway
VGATLKVRLQPSRGFIVRYVSFIDNGSVRPGLLEGATVRALPARIATLIDYIALEPRERAALELGEPLPLASLTLDAPVRPRKNVFCVGRNYMGHAEEVARASGRPLNLPSVPTFFTKAPTAIVGPGAALHLSPAVSQEYDWEAELAVVIGERCRDVPEESALGVVFGYACLNDVTARDLQRAHQQWFKGKSLDETCPIGPWIVGAEEIGDPQTLEISLRLNGERKQHANTSTMIFSVRKVIAALSRGMTLEPGDVIATGTPDGVGFARTPPEFLKDGDVLEVEIAKIGILRNTIAGG